MQMATYENAVDRLRDELAKKHDHPGVQAIGEYLTGRLNADHGLADKICADGKSIEGAFEAIRAYARKIQKGGQAYVKDEKALEIACEYYGIPADQKQNPCGFATCQEPGKQAGIACAACWRGHAGNTQTFAQKPAPAAPANDGLDLDALLGM